MTRVLGEWREDSPIREAAWVARCVGDAETAPLSESDISALAAYLETRDFERGALVFDAGERPAGVWILRSGLMDLSAGTGRRKVVVQVLYPGSVDGDIQLILDMAVPYGGRAIEDARCLFLEAEAFERLLRDHPAVARRWLSSVAARVSKGQTRLLALLGKPLVEQIARLLLDEETDGRLPLPQRTLAAMLGVQRPSLNKVLRNLQRKGHIELGYGEIIIRDRAALASLAPGRPDDKH